MGALSTAILNAGNFFLYKKCIIPWMRRNQYDSTDAQKDLKASFRGKSFFALYILFFPIYEEYIFRGLFYKNPERVLAKISYVGLSSLYFGIFHVWKPFLTGTLTPPQICLFFNTTILGCLWSCLRLTTGDLTAPISGHIMNNFFALYVTNPRLK